MRSERERVGVGVVEPETNIHEGHGQGESEGDRIVDGGLKDRRIKRGYRAYEDGIGYG